MQVKHEILFCKMCAQYILIEISKVRIHSMLILHILVCLFVVYYFSVLIHMYEVESRPLSFRVYISIRTVCVWGGGEGGAVLFSVENRWCVKYDI